LSALIPAMSAYFYLIESGKVQARQAGEVTVTEYSILSLGAGESFPIGAVTAGRPSTNTYIAVEDTSSATNCRPMTSWC
jgi:CBS domain-containing protein